VRACARSQPTTTQLPKNWKKDLHNDAARGVEDNPSPDTYVRPEDLRVGGEVNVFGRTLKICACDKFTSTWYRNNKGFVQPGPVGGDSKEYEEAKREVPIPPYTGFGDEADSLASFYSLVPKPPKKDFNKFMMNDRKVLRFSARLARACPEDRHRSFIIQLYLADDTLAIYEPAVRVCCKCLLQGEDWCLFCLFGCAVLCCAVLCMCTPSHFLGFCFVFISFRFVSFRVPAALCFRCLAFLFLFLPFLGTRRSATRASWAASSWCATSTARPTARCTP